MTLVEAVTRPIIRAMLPGHPKVARLIQTVVPVMITIGLAASAAPWLKVSYQLGCLVGLINYILDDNRSFYGNGSKGIMWVLF